MSGFITLHRKSLNSWLWDMPASQTKVAITLMLMANWKDGGGFYNGQYVEVTRGQVMTSIEKVSLRARVSFSQCRTALKNLKKCKFLTSKSTSKFTMITILNYDDLQSKTAPTSQAESHNVDTTFAQRSHNVDTSLATIEQRNKGTKETMKQGKTKQPFMTKAMKNTIYNLFPKKVCKMGGMKKLDREVKTAEDYELLLACVQSMARDYKDHDPKFVPNFATFIGNRRWEDERWLAPDGVTPGNVTAKDIATKYQDLTDRPDDAPFDVDSLDES